MKLVKSRDSSVQDLRFSHKCRLFVSSRRVHGRLLFVCGAGSGSSGGNSRGAERSRADRNKSKLSKTLVWIGQVGRLHPFPPFSEG